MNNSYDFFAMLSRMKYINRWGLMRNTIKENIAEHSLETAMLAHCLAMIRNTYFGGNIDAERVCLLALFHDATEIITGDMPTPIKYFAPTIRDAYKEVEKMAADRLLTQLPEELAAAYEPILLEREEEKELWKLVKAADKISALIKCTEELQMGNQDFVSAEYSCRRAVEKMQLAEADYFLEHFLPAYKLTLDEQA
ncbi:MAG: 5'-deoxynucleotidase [Lachnospiraceae bacterium]|nr:5'-deoxynucleotidase [Lachnospiraceae bacterium]